MPLVGRLIDRFRKQEGFIEPIEFVSDRLGSPVRLRRAFARFGLNLPDMQDAIVDQAQVAGRWLQQREFVNEQASANPVPSRSLGAA